MSEQEPPQPSQSQQIDPFETEGMPKNLEELKNEIGKTLCIKGSGSWLGIFNNKVCALKLSMDIALREGSIIEDEHNMLLAAYNDLNRRRELTIKKTSLHKTPNLQTKDMLMKKYINVVNLYNDKKNEKIRNPFESTT